MDPFSIAANPIDIAWDVDGAVDIASDVNHDTVINLELEGFVAEAAADAEAVSDNYAAYTFSATETLAFEGGASSSSYSISQVDVPGDFLGGGGGGGGGEGGI